LREEKGEEREAMFDVSSAAANPWVWDRNWERVHGWRVSVA